MVNLGVRVIPPRPRALFEPDTDTGRRFLHAVDSSARSTSTQGAVAAGTLGGEAPAPTPSAKTPRASGQRMTPRRFRLRLQRGAGRDGGRAIPFELEMVEAALQETMSQLYAKLEFCEERCRRAPSQPAEHQPGGAGGARWTKQSLVALGPAGAVRQVLLDTLDDDEDIADFTISSTATSEEDKEDEEEEVENLIEYYLQQTETAQRRRAAAGKHAHLEESISCRFVAAIRSVQAGADAVHRDVRRRARGAGHGHLRHEPVVVPGDVHLRCLPDVLPHRHRDRGTIFQSIAVHKETEDPLSASFAKATPREARETRRRENAA